MKSHVSLYMFSYLKKGKSRDQLFEEGHNSQKSRRQQGRHLYFYLGGREGESLAQSVKRVTQLRS